MCLAVPVKIMELDNQNAVVDVGGVHRTCNVAFIPEPQIGDYVLLHAGFAIQKWTEEDVLEYDQIMKELDLS